MKARVYLATTAGPVRVERLTRERAQQSAVCLGRTTKVLAVSSDYDAFVRQPSGVIEREFGHVEPGAFRLDVDGSIDDGDSWQLGVFAAHMLAQDHGLAGPDDPADRAIWLTGAVHNDLTVEPVDHVAEKLQASSEVFAALTNEGIPLTLVLPPGGKARAVAEGIPPSATVVEVASTHELAPVLNTARTTLSAGRRARDSTLPGAAPQPRGRRVFLGIAVLSVVVVAALFALLVWRKMEALRAIAHSGAPIEMAKALEEAERTTWPVDPVAARLFLDELEERKPRSKNVRLQLHERRAPAERTCAAVHFGNVSAQLTSVPEPSGPYATSRQEGLCGLEISVEVGPIPYYIAAAMEASSGKFIEARAVPEALTGKQAFTGRQSWAMDLPRRMDEPLIYRVIVVASQYPVDDGSGRWRELITAEGTAKFAELGLLIEGLEHRVIP